jgi:hypothetical protein
LNGWMNSPKSLDPVPSNRSGKKKLAEVFCGLNPQASGDAKTKTVLPSQAS